VFSIYRHDPGFLAKKTLTVDQRNSLLILIPSIIPGHGRIQASVLPGVQATKGTVIHPQESIKSAPGCEIPQGRSSE